ncbi:hypothetical protein O9K51_08560 [Purpureocillium lavendulum]|uniref:Uncharacterized protein n=1 Tax=Purpureocillium lavendulum TaxID=1247861 RepID=A0AB34FIW4_9HYPO|nr:hypothetical protein O9K51_08560 [Purpureocillium lavendulum]
MMHNTDKSTMGELNEADAKVDTHSCLDDGFDKQMEDFLDYILDTEAFEDMETHVNEETEAVSMGLEQCSGDK